MFKKVLEWLTPDYISLKNRTIFFILFLVGLFIRLPFFFRDYIDRDESTFILMGQSWVNGHLPYTELWDLKPPLAFLFFAGIIYTFGKSFFAIRFFGTVVIAITAFFTYKIGHEVSSKKTGFWAAIVCIALQSMFGSLQGVMSEHLCMPFFMIALYIIMKYEKPYTFLISGLLMGISIMIKLNLAYVTPIIGLYILYSQCQKKNLWTSIKNSFVYGLGVTTIIGLTILPYYLQGDINLWWKSVIEAPLNYAASQRESILKNLPFYIVLLGFFLFVWKKKYVDFKKPKTQLLLVTFIGVLVSFFQGGRVNGHYLIQLFPILIIFIGIALSSVSYFRKINYKPFVLVLCLLLPIEAYIEYVAVVKNKIENGTFYNGEGISVPYYITKNNLNTKNILFLEYHIGYWVLGVNPPTKAATHPSNICREELFLAYNNPRKTSLEELAYILDELKPKTIVTRKGRSIFDKKLLKENEYINSYLAKYYVPIQVVEKAEIYQRLE